MCVNMDIAKTNVKFSKCNYVDFTYVYIIY